MQATHRSHDAVIVYLPFYRRLLVRTGAVWCVIRLVLEAGSREVEGAGLHPLPALGLIGLVLVIDLVNARAMRESVFRANAGVSTASALLPAGLLLVCLELVFRALLRALPG